MAITKRPRKRNPKIEKEWPKLYSAIGKSIASWSNLEHALASAFAITLGIKGDVAERIFFSARTFNGKHDMLMAALRADPLHESHPHYVHQLVIISALKKAEKWASARNKLAHERPTVGAIGEIIVGGVLTPNVLHKDIAVHFQQSLTTEAIVECAASFNDLTRIIEEALAFDEDASIDKLLQRVRALPPCPYSDSLERRVKEARALRRLKRPS